MSNFNRLLTEPPLKLKYGWIIAHIRQWMLLFIHVAILVNRIQNVRDQTRWMKLHPTIYRCLKIYNINKHESYHSGHFMWYLYIILLRGLNDIYVCVRACVTYDYMVSKLIAVQNTNVSEGQKSVLKKSKQWWLSNMFYIQEMPDVLLYITHHVTWDRCQPVTEDVIVATSSFISWYRSRVTCGNA